MQDAGLDPTTPTGAAGLFTDAGAYVDAANEVGLASRISVNAVVDPDRGGESWRLRDGLGAAVRGPVGNAELLHSFASALSSTRSYASGGFAGQIAAASDLASLVTEKFGSQRLGAEQKLTFASVRATEAEQFLMADGVDTDRELQRLMLIEQAYAANARVLQTVDDMMNALMGALR